MPSKGHCQPTYTIKPERSSSFYNPSINFHLARKPLVKKASFYLIADAYFNIDYHWTQTTLFSFRVK